MQFKIFWGIGKTTQGEPVPPEAASIMGDEEVYAKDEIIEKSTQNAAKMEVNRIVRADPRMQSLTENAHFPCEPEWKKWQQENTGKNDANIAYLLRVSKTESKGGGYSINPKIKSPPRIDYTGYMIVAWQKNSPDE